MNIVAPLRSLDDDDKHVSSLSGDVVGRPDWAVATEVFDQSLLEVRAVHQAGAADVTGLCTDDHVGETFADSGCGVGHAVGEAQDCPRGAKCTGSLGQIKVRLPFDPKRFVCRSGVYYGLDQSGQLKGLAQGSTGVNGDRHWWSSLSLDVSAKPSSVRPLGPLVQPLHLARLSSGPASVTLERFNLVALTLFGASVMHSRRLVTISRRRRAS